MKIAKSHVRTIGLALGLLSAIAIDVVAMNRSYPISHWLFWIYAKIWLATLFFGISCFCLGHAILLRLLQRTLPIIEHIVLAFAIGVFGFFISVFVGGLLGILRPGFFFLAPTILAAAGMRPASRFVRRIRYHLRALRGRPSSLWEIALIVAGCGGLALIYFEILTPENVAYDARWYHLPIAEHYVAQGAIRPFPEGWFLGAYPHLASHLYAWAMLLPKAVYFEKVELCAHIEFLIFLATLAGIVALVPHLLPNRRRIHLAWVAIFLFPEIFLYDSSLTVGADHIAAFWAPVILILFFRTIRSGSAIFAALLGLALAAAVGTKTSAISIVAFPALAFMSWCVWTAIYPRVGYSRMTSIKLLIVAAIAGLAASSPYWLKNWIWYGDPVYPMLRHYLNIHPSTPDFSIPLEYWFYPPFFHPPRTLAGAWETVRALFNYSFVPRDWKTFHRDVPIFGSLATLSLLWLPFLRKSRRIWVVIAAIHMGIFIWYTIHHFDRYLQAILPWMVAALVATCSQLWQQNRLARPFLGVIIGLQLVWGGDVYFFPTHAMAGSSLKKSIDLISSGFSGNYNQRFSAPFGDFLKIGYRLKHNDKVLIHENHVHWALQAMSVSDWQGSQGGISYVRARTAGGVYDLLSGMGVTHLLYDASSSKGYDTLGGDLLFFSFSSFYGERSESFGGQVLSHMPAARPRTDVSNDIVAFLGCADTYQNGLYHVSELTAADLDPKRAYPAPFQILPRKFSVAEAGGVLTKAAFAVVDPGCYPNLLTSATESGLVKLVSRGRLVLFARAPISQRPPPP
ncbi:MAG TPA: hypothetical protein VH374_08895 [Polyangia bacterium]|jgi:hypothetical protein|nr:hypothetical protein [Polyangia bacterium]